MNPSPANGSLRPAVARLAVALAITAAMDATGLAMFSALPLLPLLPLAGLFWFLWRRTMTAPAS